MSRRALWAVWIVWYGKDIAAIYVLYHLPPDVRAPLCFSVAAWASFVLWLLWNDL